jgi:beta-1,4-N-acetylglucosaminyltransferase
MKIIAISSSGGHSTELNSFLAKANIENPIFAIEGNNGEGYKLPSSRRNNKIVFIINFLVLILKSIYIYIKERPEMIITTGANTAVPLCWLARKSNVKIIYIESIARVNTKSKTGKIIEKYNNSVILVQWQEMTKVYNNSIFIGRVL